MEDTSGWKVTHLVEAAIRPLEAQRHWLLLLYSDFSELGPRLSSLLNVYFHHYQLIIPIFPMVHPSEERFYGSLYIIELHPWHHNWPPHRYLKFTTFQTDLTLLLPSLGLHLDVPVDVGNLL